MTQALFDIFAYNQHFVNMMNVINAAKLNPPDEGQNHHIIPKCWFKMNNLPVDNSKDNLVLLSYEDHVKVHRLALLCVTEPMMRSKMALAVHRVSKGEYSEPKYWSGEMNPNFGKPRSEETRRKISEAKRSRMNDETRRRIAEAKKGKNNPMYGKSPSDETRLKRSESLKGKRFSEERRKHISEALKGKIVSEETRKRISEVQKGKRLSEDTRKRISEALKGRVHVNKGKPISDCLKEVNDG